MERTINRCQLRDYSMLRLCDKHLKPAILTMLIEVKENTLEMKGNIGNPRR